MSGFPRFAGGMYQGDSPENVMLVFFIQVFPRFIQKHPLLVIVLYENRCSIRYYKISAGTLRFHYVSRSDFNDSSQASENVRTVIPWTRFRKGTPTPTCFSLDLSLMQIYLIWKKETGEVVFKLNVIFEACQLMRMKFRIRSTKQNAPKKLRKSRKATFPHCLRSHKVQPAPPSVLFFWFSKF